jgi:hypothetical protein
VHADTEAGRRPNDQEIARAYLTTEATVAQWVVRTKRTLADADAAIEEPSEAERAERLTTVLSVIFLLYNEGYAATAGNEWMRPTLCDEALRLEADPRRAGSTGERVLWTLCAHGAPVVASGRTSRS